jgi:hypothetical protein
MRIPRMPQNEKGVILLTVIMMAILLSMVIIGVMSASVTQVKSSQTIIDHMKAENLAMGEFYRYTQQINDGNFTVPPSTIKTIGDKSYTITYANVTGGTNPNSTDRLRIQITY